MAAQRPKRSNSPINSKNQPLKATVPLSSLVRNPSPTRRRTSPSSPGLPPDKRNRIRRSPDVGNNEQRNLFSPLGSKDFFKPVLKKSNKKIRRTNSLETLSTSYINGQWPRSENIAFNSNIGNKGTQTPSWYDHSGDEQHVSTAHDQIPALYDHRNSNKQIFLQVLQRSKQQSSQPRQPFPGKQSPLQGDHHATLAHHHFSPSYVPSKPVAIPQVPSSPKQPSLHTRRSVEGLNFELEVLDLGGEYILKTPPDGRKPPIHELTVKHVDTQTSNGWIDSCPVKATNKRSQSTSPSWPSSPTEQKTLTKPPLVHRRSVSAGAKGTCGVLFSPASATTLGCRESPKTSCRESPETANVSKYADSPKPNNSFWFSRGPPDGAEKMELKKTAENEEEAYSCPDVSKCSIQFSKDSAFHSLPYY